jgi:hypothetical protein
MPLTVSYPLGLLTMFGPPPPDGGTGTTGAAAVPAPLTQVFQWVSFVPHGHSLAAAGDAHTNGAAAKATAHPKTTTPRLTVTI